MIDAPVIGITGQRLATAEIRTAPDILLHTSTDAYLAYYAQAISRAGGIPVHLAREAAPERLVERLDGVVIAGGQDVDPRAYGQMPLPTATRLDPVRDRFERALIIAALEQDKPLVGVCRGMQLLNVALGGTLVPDLLGRQQEEHTLILYPPEVRVHEVTFTPGSRMDGIYGGAALVNSFHHQAVDALGDGVEVAGQATDGVVEAIEVTGTRAVGVQWHPEMLTDLDPLFTWLIEESARATDRDEGVALERSA